MGRRVNVVVSVVVERPSEEVFDYLNDVARHGEWSPKAYRVEGVEVGTPAEEGTRYASYGWLPNAKDHRNDVEVTQVQRPDRLILTATDRGEKFMHTFTLSPAGSGTRLERAVDMPHPGGPVGVVFPLIVRFLIKPDVSRGLGMLKAKLESRPESAAG